MPMICPILKYSRPETFQGTAYCDSIIAVSSLEDPEEGSDWVWEEQI